MAQQSLSASSELFANANMTVKNLRQVMAFDGRNDDRYTVVFSPFGYSLEGQNNEIGNSIRSPYL
jgi:hypothetical protein